MAVHSYYNLDRVTDVALLVVSIWLDLKLFHVLESYMSVCTICSSLPHHMGGRLRPFRVYLTCHHTTWWLLRTGIIAMGVRTGSCLRYRRPKNNPCHILLHLKYQFKWLNFFFLPSNVHLWMNVHSKCSNTCNLCPIFLENMHGCFQSL